MTKKLPKDWDDDVVRQYLTPESHQKSREEFEKTHIDIDKIKADYLFSHPSNDDFVTQEEFRDAILRSNIDDDNRIFILRGETGSGKSQLCQWLEYQIGDRNSGIDDTHVALHISRSQTRIEDIVDILTEPVDVDIQVGNVESLDPVKVADAMVTNLDAYAPTAFQDLSPDEVEALIEQRPGTDLRSILEENIAEYQKAVASEDEGEIPDLLDEKDYRNLAISAFGQAQGGKTIFSTLLGFLHDELSGKLNVGNFQDKLEQISDAYEEEGLRPVLICEDLTTFSVLKEQLLDHIFQLDSGHYDVVLGWTTGWEKDNLNKALGTSENTYTYMKDRAEGYLSTTDESGQAYFLTEDVTVELARKYVEVIREESSADTTEAITEEAFDGLYPFNPEFIRNAYEHLIQDGNERRTPRLLLIRIVRECLTSTAPPFDSIDGNPYVKQFPAPVSLDLPADVQNLAKWYGIPSAGQNIQLPRGIFEAFGVPVPDEVIENNDPVVIQGTGKGVRRDFLLEQTEGIAEPGATVCIKTTLNGRPEADVDIELDGTPTAFTGDNGTAEIQLPNKEGDVTIAARKADLSDRLTFTLGRDSMNISARPSKPEEGEEVTITARINGEPTESVEIFKDNERFGTTGADGTISMTADESPEITIRGEFEDIEDTRTIDVISGGNYPVETDYSPDEVDQRRFEYERWLKTGSEYNSSGTLRSGAVSVLESWFDPTRLANPNASATGVTGIYYARGSETPVSIQSVDERNGLSIELPFGTEHNDVYEPLLWSGISANDSLPTEDQYTLNYDLLRGWATDQVAEFRQSMRDEIEEQLPENWTIEEFVIVAQYLLSNAGDGTTELSRELVFQEYRTPTGYDHPIRERFSADHSYREAYTNLTKSSSVPTDLAEGFFKLKENFVDNHRLNEAYETVETNLDSYIREAMYIDDELPDAYRLGTTRSNASIQLEPVFTRIKEYAQELHSLSQDDISHVESAVERIDTWFDESHDVPQLRELYKRAYDAVGTMDITVKQRWDKQLDRLESGEDIHLTAFQSDIEEFREIQSASGPELIRLLHRFEESKANRIEWDIYEAIDEMIVAANGIDVPETSTELKEKVQNSDEMNTLLNRRRSIEKILGGE